MAIVTGYLADISDLALPSPRIKFVPSGPSIVGDFIHATKPVYAYPEEDGSWAVGLTETDSLRPSTYYTMTLEWLDDASNYMGADYLTWQLNVPSEGGEIGDLLGTFVAPNSMQVFWGPAAPSPWPQGLVWVNSVTGDVKRMD